MNTQNDDARALLGPWALDAVDDVERALVERAIADDPELATEARELQETVARIAEADAHPPPAQVRDAVLSRIQSTAQVEALSAPSPTAKSPAASSDDAGPAQPGRPRPTRHVDELAVRRRRRWRALGAAAALIVAVGIPTTVAVNEADRADRAEQQIAQAEQQAAQAEQQAQQIADALAQPGAQLAAEDLPDGSRAAAVLSEDSALFTAQGMAELDDQDYQLWVLADEDASSAGVLDWQDGRLTAHVEQFPADASLAVTAEPLGGSDQPTSDPLVVLGPS